MRLSSFEKRLTDFALPVPTAEEMDQIQHVSSDQPAVIREELAFDFDETRKIVEDSRSSERRELRLPSREEGLGAKALHL